MKKIINLSLLLSFLAFFMLMGCQKEEQEFIDETTEETITANSALANLLSRTTQNDGGFDDLIDNNNCASVVLPVTVVANGQEVVINNEDDYDTVEDIFDQFPTDTDTLEIIFPIQIVLANFETVTVNSQEELDVIIAACDDDDPNNDSISCVDIVYPITFFIYDSEQQQIGTETVNSDVELFLFLLNLDENLFVSIDFPITVIVDGTAIEVTSNEQLELLISQADCDDDDDDINNEEFTEILTDGVWYVTEYFDDTDQTGLFTGYEFTFATDNTALATDGSNNVPGTWNLSSSSSDLDLFFGTANPFDELDDDWDIIEYTTDIIRLKDVSGGNGGTDYLTFERTPGNGNNDDLNMFIENLTDGGWFVTVLEEDSDPNEACDYNGYEFNFLPNGTATAISTSNTVNGLWTANGSGSNIDLILNFENSGGDDPFEDLNDNWDVLQGTSLIIELTDVSGGGGGTDFLSFERTAPDCGGGSGDVTAFVNQLTDDDWFVTLLEEDGDPDEACNYVDYEFTFSTDGTVVAVSSGDNVNGFWSAVNSSGGIDLSLDFDITNPIFDDLNDEDWEVLEFDANIIRLRDVSGGGGGTDLLNFGRTPPAGCDPTGASDLEDILIDGIWIVASYDEDGDDQTSDYNGYSLDFMTGGAVSVSGPTNFSGAWAVIPSGGNLEMSLNFGTSIPFDEFNDDDWEVIDVQSNRVEIRDVSGGGGGIDTLVLEKL